MPTQRSKYPWGASPRMPRRCRGISLPPSKPSVLPPPSQREAGSSAPAGAGDGFPRQSADWLGMTGQEQGAGTVNGCRGGRPHAAAICAYITGHRPLALPLGELSPQVTERAGMVMVCPLRPRCARPPLPEGEARDAHTAHQNVCRGGRFLARRLSISRKCALHLGESVGIIVEKTDVCSYAGHTSVV